MWPSCFSYYYCYYLFAGFLSRPAVFEMSTPNQLWHARTIKVIDPWAQTFVPGYLATFLVVREFFCDIAGYMRVVQHHDGNILSVVWGRVSTKKAFLKFVLLIYFLGRI